MSAAMTGHCLCGAVTVTLDNPKSEVEICQCAMCRRWGGAFYAALTGEDFTIGGEESITAYASSDWGERAFCSHCGTNIWWHFKPTGNRGFSGGIFDNAAGLTIEKEIFVDEGADWCRLKGDHPRQTGEEAIAEAKAAGFSFD